MQSWHAFHLLLISGLFLGVASLAQTGPGEAAPQPFPPLPPSPVAFFRELLDQDKTERERQLASRSEAQRRSIEAKLEEYEALPPFERELRLQATEFQWYLRPLLLLEPDQRAARVLQVPEPMRDPVEQRLAAWDRLTEATRLEFLKTDWALQYFLRFDAPPMPTPTPPVPPTASGRHQLLELELARWQAIPPQRRIRIAERFHDFFELSPSERERTLELLPESERRPIESTIEAFARLPAAQRQASLDAFQRFAALSPAERAEFLRNADRWKEMSPADRATWRRLVPKLPPSPPGLFEPPMPPGASSPQLPPSIDQRGGASDP
jgi:hypothetical protein